MLRAFGKTFCLGLISLSFLIPSYGQNLVPNPSFEDFSVCPEYIIGGICDGYAPPWQCGTDGSADYFNSCVTSSSSVDVPDNFNGSQLAHTGEAYAGAVFTFPQNYREYLLVQLTEPLVADSWYQVNFYVSLSDYSCGVEEIGAYFSVTSPWQPIITVLNVVPQIVHDLGYVTDTENWVLISGCFLAEGGEEFLTIGNFHPNAETPVDPNCNSDVGYYYVDDVSVIESDAPSEFLLDLGGPEVVCFSYEIDPGLSDYYFAWSDGSHESTLVVTETGTYSLFVTDGCHFASGEIDVAVFGYIDPIDIGPDQLTLCSGEVYTISLDWDLFDYTWNDGSSGPEYSISTPGVYSVTLNDGCTAQSDDITIMFLDPPSPFLGPDAHLCAGDSLILDGDNIQGNYLWQDNSSLSQYQVTSPGTYALTISNACGTGIDTIFVDYSAPLNPPDLGPDFSLCPGDSLILHVTSPGASYLWQDTTTLDSIVVSTAGTYYVRVYDVCSTYTDTVIVSVNDNPPHIDLPTQLSLCQGQSITLDAAISGVSYLWSDNSLNQQLTVAAPGVYSLTVTNVCGTDVDTTIILDGGVAPAVELGNNIDLCPGESIVLSPVYTNVDNWLWQDGSVADSIVIAGASQVIVEVNNSCGSAYDTLNTNLLPPTPPLDLGVDTSLCSGESFILSILTPGVIILWPDGSNDPDYLVSGAGIVFASIANCCGQSLDTIQVNPLPDIPSLNLGPDKSLCPGEIISLSPGIANVTYEWQDGTTNNSYQSTQEETIILTITNDCGTASDTLEVFESTDGPQVDLGPDILACEGEIITIPSGISGVNYFWQDGSIDPVFVTAVSDTLILQVSNLCGTDADSLIVDIHGVAPTPHLGDDATVCEGILVVLYSTADAETTVTWQDGSTQRTFFVSSPGIYSIYESNHCGNAADTIVVDFIDAPDDFTLGPDTMLCPGEFITLIAPVTGYEIQWQDGSNQISIIADEAITYSLQLSNECGIQSDSISVSIDIRTPAVNLDPSISWCEGDIITLDASQSFTAAYQWSSGETTPLIEVLSTGVYSIEISTPCTALSQSVDIIPGTDCFVAEIHNDIYIPNVFSPNGDGINDVFTVNYGTDPDVIGMEVSIFDRWGNLVYKSNENPFMWDGLFVGQVLKPGVFVYVIKVFYLADPVGKTLEVFTGDITLLR